MNDTDITDNDRFIGKRIQRKDNRFSPHLSLFNSPPFSARYNESESENLQKGTIQEIYPSEMKQSLKNSLIQRSLFTHLTLLKCFYFLMLHLILNNTELSERDPVLKVVHEWMQEKSRPVAKVPAITAFPFLLEYYR